MSPRRKRRPRPDRTTPIGRRVRERQAGGSKTETYRALPVEPGDTHVGWVRRRKRSATGVPVNARMDLPWRDYWWVRENEWSEIACTICGTTMREERLGVTWGDGEARIRRLNREGGGYRSRGPVLWAMHVIKFERFGDEHLRCEQTYPNPETRPPPDIAWLCIWGDACDLANAVYNDPSLLVDYWAEFSVRDDAWSPSVRRRLRRAYQTGGSDAVRQMMGNGVSFTVKDDDGKRVTRVWELIPF